MYTLAIGLQLFAVIICLTATVLTAFKKTSSYSNTILVTFICGFIQNAGYLMELTAKSAAEGMFAIRTEYIGGAFEICLLTFFIFRYCGHELKFPVRILLLVYSAFILTGVWTWEYNHMYYTGAAFVSDSILPHMVMGHGWLYYTYAATTVVELIACVFILLVSMLRTTQKHMINNYFILLAVVVIPFLGFIVSVAGIFSAFDATPLSVAIAVGLFGVSLARDHVFDVTDTVGGDIIAHLDNAVIILNNENGYEYSNERANMLFPVLENYKRGEVIREHEISVLFDQSRQDDVKIGKRLFDVSVNTVQSGVRNEIVGKSVLLFDVTDNSIQLGKMKELMDLKEKSDRSKSAFLANVAHEIRTPINVIMGLCEVLQRDYASPETEEYLANMKNSSMTLINLVSDVLDYSRIEEGRMDIVRDKFDMKAFLTEIVNIYKFRCSTKELEFIYEIPADLPKYFIGDIIRIKQVINNLMGNAIRYTERGSVKFKLTYKYRSDYDIDLIIAIEDTGVGIKFEDREKVFDGFESSEITMVSDAEGTELGLNITKKLVELMGGVINFRSEFGKGTVFSVIIPARVVGDAIETVGEVEEHDKDKKVYRAEFIAPDAKILVVDDSRVNLLVIKELIKDTKVQITTATNGEKCLELVENEHFDIIFLDHKMPGMDGLETFSRLRRSSGEGATIPVVMLTANATAESRDFYISRNFTDYLSKPISSENIIMMLYKYLPENLIIMNE